MNYLFLNSNFALNLQGKCWKDDVVTFTVHLSVTIKGLTRYKQKVVLAAMLEGKSMLSNMAAKTNHTSLLKNQSAIKYLPWMLFLSNLRCKITFMCSVNFWYQEALVTWHLSASGLLSCNYNNIRLHLFLQSILKYYNVFVFKTSTPWYKHY